MTEHTPTPYQLGYPGWDDSDTICNEKGYTVCTRPKLIDKEDWVADAEFIVRAVNSHDALVAALKAMMSPAMMTVPFGRNRCTLPESSL